MQADLDLKPPFEREPDGPGREHQAVRDRLGGGVQIRCPRCGWRPRQHDRWMCEPSCRMLWNTFDTAGKCPRCHKQWEVTQCLACHCYSPHLDWYELGDKA